MLLLGKSYPFYLMKVWGYLSCCHRNLRRIFAKECVLQIIHTGCVLMIRSKRRSAFTPADNTYFYEKKKSTLLNIKLELSKIFKFPRYAASPYWCVINIDKPLRIQPCRIENMTVFECDKAFATTNKVK